jgi:hypothetical protein
MATTSSRQSSLFGLSDWTKFYQAYSSADFQSYDYETLRAAFIQYLTQNFPEAYNDYVESSEFVAILDVMAYLGQALAFRSDINAREGFMDTAERRDSVIKLANLVSYNPKRNNAAQGLVKVTAIATTENLTDINGVNLSNTTILWNDPANSSWQEQFNTILNATFINSQRVGRPGNSQTVLNVKTDEYTINTPQGTLPVIPYQAEIDGSVMNFELVSSTSLNQPYIYELPPAPSSQFNILYRNDKLGYGSINTGFFFYFKQGSLQSQDINFPEEIENNIQPINVQGINETDTWLYKLTDQGVISQLWTQVESVYTGNTNSQGQSVKPIFSVTSRANDEVTYVFSDGVFGEIPFGLFRAYFRASNALQYVIDPAEMNGITASIEYVSRVGTTEVLTFTFSLQVPSNTAQNRETLAAIKERAPSRYYTQNRMVNGEDYTNFPFTLYNSIIKSKALNRTSIGVTRGLDLLDPTGKYSSTNVFATDGAVFFNDTPTTSSFSTLSTTYATEFLTATLPTLLASSTSIQYYQQYYPWYSGVYSRSSMSEDNSCYWQQTTVSGSQVTGYFFIKEGSPPDPINPVKTPIAIGQYSTETMRYISQGAQLRFKAPTGMYFDVNNRLTTTNTGVQTIWVAVSGVVGDGFNFGSGNLPSGLGPVTLSSFVPTGAFLDKADPSIIPQFDNTLSNTLVSDCLARIKLNQDFVLKFDNSILSTLERWSISTTFTSGATGYFVSFVHSSIDNSYTVTVKNVEYTFASVAEVRFIYDGTRKIYDPKSGQIVSDYVNIIKNNGPIPVDTYLNVTGQPVQSDGFINDFEVIVSAVNPNTGYSSNPLFFTELLGLAHTDPLLPLSVDTSVFFATAKDSNGITTLQVLPKGFVIYGSTLANANISIYEYTADTVFYCPQAIADLKLYITIVYPGVYTVTAVASLPHNLSQGDSVTISDATVSQCNGTFVTTSVTATSFTYTVESQTAIQSTILTLSPTVLVPSTSYTVTATSNVAHGLATGNTVNIQGSTQASYNGSFTVTVTNATTFTYTVTTPSTLTSSTAYIANVTADLFNRFYQSSVVEGVTPTTYKFTDVTSQYSVECGRNTLSFQYRHNSGETSRIDPSTTNIIDLYLVTQAYYTSYMNWLADTTGQVVKPVPPTINELQQSYGKLDSYKMISDSVVMNSVAFKPLFGTKASTNLQGTIKVIKSPATTASDSQIRSSVLSAMNTYFSIDNWNFGDVFYFSELTAYLHLQLGSLISSVVLVPANPSQKFGDLYEIRSAPNEIFVNGATISDITVISALTSANMNR